MSKQFLVFFETPIGKLGLVETQGYITKIILPTESEVSDDFILNETKEINEAKKQLKEYFCGLRKMFTFKYKQEGTDFRKKVWEELTKIPYGETCSYKDIAIRINSPLSCRAVGQANNKNNLPIVVPCHRVVGTNNSLVGYAGGLDIKMYLLKLEKLNI